MARATLDPTMAGARGPVRTRWPRAWALWRMARPDHLVLIGAVYALGVAVAHGRGVATASTGLLDHAVGLAVLLAVAASVHYANEFADFWTDRLTTRTPFSGGSGALARTGLPRVLALEAALAAALVGGLGGVLAVACGHLPTTAGWLLGGILVGGWAYSVPPPALAWRGAGEVTNAALGGLALPLYGYVVAGGRPAAVAVAAFLPLFAVVLANLLATQWPDRVADAAVGKHTLAVRWPAGRLRVAYLGVLAAWVLAVGGLGAVGVPPRVAVASLAVLPLLAVGARGFTRRRSPLPTVAAMVGLVAAQLVAWASVALGSGG